MTKDFMTNHSLRRLSISLIPCVLAIAASSTRSVVAQNPDMQQKVAALKAAMAQNKQALAQYTWAAQATISLKGEKKNQEHFQVGLAPNAKPQKTSLDPPAQPAQPPAA